MNIVVRPAAAADRTAVQRLVTAAFAGETEAALVERLRAEGFARVELVATTVGDGANGDESSRDETVGEIVGHILFSAIEIVTSDGSLPALSLAPLAVAPEHQRRGYGGALVRAGLAACRAAGHRVVLVLGHPEYYPRFGFSAALAQRVANPFHAGEAWMALELVPGALAGVAGAVRYSPPFGIG